MNTVFFGAKDKKSPFPVVNFIGPGNEAVFISRTNFNLFLSAAKLDFLSIGALLDHSNEALSYPNSHISGNARHELLFSPDVCFQCAERMLGCPLVVQDVIEEAVQAEEPSDDGSVIRGEVKCKWWSLKTEFEMDDWKNVCPFFQALIELTETQAERRFLELYLDEQMHQFARDISHGLSEGASRFMDYNRDILGPILVSTPGNRVPGGWARRSGKFVGTKYGVPLTVALFRAQKHDRRVPEQLDADRSALPSQFRLELENLSAMFSNRKFEFAIGTPPNLNALEVYELFQWLRRPLNTKFALLPQVWIRHIYHSKVAPADDVLRDEDSYSRVDFGIWWGKGRAIVEIDGPEHYAEFDKRSSKWTTSEDIYTKNLRRERALKRDGWTFFRLSNLEVSEANSWRALDQKVGIENGVYRFDDDLDLNVDYPSESYF